MMFLKILILFLLVENYGADHREQIDYEPKLLKKELKNANLEDSQLAVIDSLGASGKIFRIQHQNKSKGFVYVGRVNSCRAGGCDNPNLNSSANNSEYFDYFILFNQEKSVISVRVFNYQATHGYEISSKAWLKQFKDYNGDKKLTDSKNVDQISGATISVNAIADDIEYITNTLRTLKK